MQRFDDIPHTRILVQYTSGEKKSFVSSNYSLIPSKWSKIYHFFNLRQSNQFIWTLPPSLEISSPVHLCYPTIQSKHYDLPGTSRYWGACNPLSFFPWEANFQATALSHGGRSLALFKFQQRPTQTTIGILFRSLTDHGSKGTKETKVNWQRRRTNKITH